MADASMMGSEPNQAVEPPLYEDRKKIYPQAVKGRFRTIKWAILIVALGVYYFLPFVRWYRGPDAPTQAVLLDLAHERFYFFGIEIWPQEVFYFTGLLVLAALMLFLMNAVAGRVWCGYFCPQTVWTDLFYAVERWVEGEKRARDRRKKEGRKLEAFSLLILKHWIWIMIAWWTGGAWVLYFADAPTLVWQLATGEAPWMAYIWIAILTFTTYALAGFLREQVCIYMCPWPRIQAALTDEYALNVTYERDRGEPRGHAKKNDALRLQGLPAGDCVDCDQCVAVCPTGVDIREGSQLGCIQCGLCIDACNNVMAKLGRAPNLITYDTDLNVKLREQGKEPIKPRVIRLRTLMYVALICAVAGVMMYSLLNRSAQTFSVLHDRNPLAVRLGNGSIRNAYTIRIGNKLHTPRTFTLNVDGIDHATVQLVNRHQSSESGVPEITVGPDQTLEARVLVTVSDDVPERKAIVFTIIDTEDARNNAKVSDHFFDARRR
ncbi:cytochrome c oxidase accessory protein CcoG [Microvirga sp. W0021]|uniref:Cytochrome c oxidase accessory protein CcoG n=1 Tax=Hohaiivirga grylli TaxID=3133970 RepID=A0ABV0BKZ6_9HYPH